MGIEQIQSAKTKALLPVLSSIGVKWSQNLVNVKSISRLSRFANEKCPTTRHIRKDKPPEFVKDCLVLLTRRSYLRGMRKRQILALASLLFSIVQI